MQRVHSFGRPSGPESFSPVLTLFAGFLRSSPSGCATHCIACISRPSVGVADTMGVCSGRSLGYHARNFGLRAPCCVTNGAAAGN